MLVYALIIWYPGFDDEFGLAKQHALEVALGPVWIVVLAIGYQLKLKRQGRLAADLG